MMTEGITWMAGGERGQTDTRTTRNTHTYAFGKGLASLHVRYRVTSPEQESLGEEKRQGVGAGE